VNGCGDPNEKVELQANHQPGASCTDRPFHTSKHCSHKHQLSLLDFFYFTFGIDFCGAFDRYGNWLAFAQQLEK
jgi:hypothetical protein